MIPGGIGEQVHLLLRDLHPVSAAEGPPDEAQQVVRLVDNGVHRSPFTARQSLIERKIGHVAAIVAPVQLVVVVVGNNIEGPVMYHSTLLGAVALARLDEKQLNLCRADTLSWLSRLGFADPPPSGGGAL
jgi:hypothetical protein